MVKVGVAGALGRMGRLVAETVAAQDDLELAACVDRTSGEAAGVPVSVERDVLAAVDVVVDFTHPDAVLDNLGAYRSFDVDAVVGTSGFTEDRLAKVRDLWEGSSRTCLIVPNFSIGAVLMMRFAEMAAPHFAASEVIELHHDRKADAPSGTALATARRLDSAGTQRRQVDGVETVSGARGADVDGVPVHSVRLPGLLAHQEVILGNPGEVLTIRHDSTDRVSFMPGVLLAVRSVGEMAPGVVVGLDELL